MPGATEFSIPVKPIVDFNSRWLALRERIRSSGASGAGAAPVRVVVVGGGAGGLEMALAMRSAIDKQKVPPFWPTPFAHHRSKAPLATALLPCA